MTYLVKIIRIYSGEVNSKTVLATFRFSYQANHWTYIFMFCKLQHGLMYGYWYSQCIKVRQVVECAWLNWCNLIGIQITTTYTIRTKYYENMRPNKYKERTKTNLGEPSL
jgi:hypothetical protein